MSLLAKVEQRRAMYQIGQVTLGDAQAYFDTLELQGARPRSPTR